ncbi:ExbD/TolR family protein [Vulgatibacter incomptus]|uniref:Adventurous gliding motility protein S n=1 Tax=Vulgatibacter incomptus TaxID=1391653 RepID=A0A0K1PF21_9BACT|nr:biopolymer transporter ExbD [Vulgatibacter incomptus]AKU92107.1 Adventurous gliding motility protein S [Vulgatibacter incomptus]
MSFSGGSDNEFDVPLNLVALIDVLTNILFFLMIGFAAQEVEVKSADKLQLPVSTTKQEIELSVSLAITTSEILIEGIPVARVVDGQIDAPRDGDKLLPIYDKLNALRAARLEKTAGLSKDDDVIFLLADRSAPFTLLAPVMKTAAMAGYPNFRFAVVKK